MTDNTVNTKIRFQTEGGDTAVKTMGDLANQAERASEKIQAADNAAKGLGDELANPLSFDETPVAAAAPKLKQASKEINDELEKTGFKLNQVGQAGSLLSSILDRAIPGLSRVWFRGSVSSRPCETNALR